jgi:hypothetical protein
MDIVWILSDANGFFDAFVEVHCVVKQWLGFVNAKNLISCLQCGISECVVQISTSINRQIFVRFTRKCTRSK